ncbi:DUF4347 domain-containing protein [Nostoc sp. DedQUE02]|uniref:DUF4347 domain-containing protein n=2 Tax=unclassified Nostoc TaxID=2593658 RepID=UPI003918B3F2
MNPKFMLDTIPTAIATKNLDWKISANRLVIIDPKVENYETLVAGVLPNTSVVVLDNDRDGIEQINQVLASYQEVNSLHIVSHGAPGRVYLGNSQLSNETLNRYAEDVQSWSSLLSSASVLLYGCNIASGEIGEAFLSKLHQLTGANIAASANPTGSTLKGGDWELEVTIGKIDTSLAFSETVREAYTSVLAIITLTGLTNPLTEGGATDTLGVSVNVASLLSSLGVVGKTLVNGGAPINLTLTPDAQLNLNGSNSSVTLTIDPTQTTQVFPSVSVAAINDNLTETNQTGKISATITTSNPTLQAILNPISSLLSANVTANILDPVTPPAIVSPITLTGLTNPLTEGGATDTLGVSVNVTDLLALLPGGVLLPGAKAEVILSNSDGQLNLNGSNNPVAIAIDTTKSTKNLSVAVSAIDDGKTEADTDNKGIISATIAIDGVSLLGLNPITVTANITDPLVSGGGTSSGDGTSSGGINDIPTLTKNANNDIFTIKGKGNSEKATLSVQLTGQSSNHVYELGVFAVDDEQGRIQGIASSDPGYVEAALKRSKVILSSLTKYPIGFNADLASLSEFTSGEQLKFYLVRDNTTDNILAGQAAVTDVLISDPTNLKVTSSGNNNFSLSWKASNSSEFKDLMFNIQATDKNLPLGTGLQGNQQGELLDLRGVTQQVKADFVVNREAAYDDVIGFYKVADTNGGIDTNGDGTADILVGQAGYAEAAIRGSVAGIDLTGNNQDTASSSGNIAPDSLYAPFIIVNGRPDAILDGNANNNPAIYFAFLGANSDKTDHIRLLENNTFGFEDLANGGDKDFNDMIVHVNLNIH